MEFSTVFCKLKFSSTDTTSCWYLIAYVHLIFLFYEPLVAVKALNFVCLADLIQCGKDFDKHTELYVGLTL